MGMVLFPRIESDYAFCEIYLPYGTPESKVREMETRLVASAQKTVDENGKQNLSTGIFSQGSENNIRVRIYLTDPEVRGGMPVVDAVRATGIQWFRPIFLTTLTTCGGLAPIITKTSW